MGGYMKRIINIILTLMMIVTGFLMRQVTVEAETTITSVAVSYTASKLTVSKKLTGRQVTTSLYSASPVCDTDAAYVYIGREWTCLVRKNGETFDKLGESDELLDPIHYDYYLMFNIENRTDSDVFDVNNLPSVTINNVAADLVEWSNQDPKGDIFAYIKVDEVTNEERVLSVDVKPSEVRVAKGTSYAFSTEVDGSNHNLEWSIQYQQSSGTYVSNGVIYVAADETSDHILVTAKSVSNPEVYDKADVFVVNEVPVITDVKISPKTATIRKAETKQFDVTVTGTDFKDVTWELSGNTSSATKLDTYNDNYCKVVVGSDESSSSLTLTVTSVRNPSLSDMATITVIDKEYIANVALTYTESDELRLSTEKTGKQITELLLNAVSSYVATDTYIYKGTDWTCLVRKNEGEYEKLGNSESLLDINDEYYFCFNVENRSGYIWDVENLPHVKINGEDADDVTWSNQSPDGDIFAYQRVYLVEQTTDHKITFNANGGSGSMPTKYVHDGDSLTLPECGFTAPLGKVFNYWKVSDRDGKFHPGDSITNITSDLTVNAYWKSRRINARIDEDILRWDALEGASYYMYGINNEWHGSVSSSSDLTVDLYQLCQLRGLSSGTYTVMLVAVNSEDMMISAKWTGSYAYQAPAADEVVITFVSNGKVIAYRTGNKNDKLMQLVDGDPVNPPKPDGGDNYVFSWWHLDSGCTEYFDDRYMTLEELNDYNGGRLYARWAIGIEEISIVNVPELSAGMTAQEYIDAYINVDEEHRVIDVIDHAKYDTVEPVGIYRKSNGTMKEFTGEFVRGKVYYLKMNLRFLKYENYRFAYDTVNNELKVKSFYLNFLKVEPIIESSGTTYCEFYLPFSFPVVKLQPEIHMGTGTTQYLNFTLSPVQPYHHIQYWSSDPSVVAIDNNGMMSALSEGFSTISVYLLDFYGNIISNNSTYVVVSDDTDYIRISDSSKLTESIKVANELRTISGIDKFSSVIVAKDSDFADALSGSYLAARKNCPILLINDSNHEEAYAYIRNNLSDGATIYILGSATAVSDAFETGLSSDPYTIVRLAGSSRYMTNLAILKEAGMTESHDVFVVTGSGFADSLSSAAIGLPILMIDNSKTSLKSSQKNWLQENDINNIYILGETASVNASLAKVLKSCCKKVTRIGGSSRWKTTRMVAEKFFPETEYVTLATGNDFADGLIASPLAYALKSPLLMVASNKTAEAKTYIEARNVTKAYIIGSKDSISDAAARKILVINDSVVIVER